jgi:hypothetical protein
LEKGDGWQAGGAFSLFSKGTLEQQLCNITTVGQPVGQMIQGGKGRLKGIRYTSKEQAQKNREHNQAGSKANNEITPG